MVRLIRLTSNSDQGIFDSTFKQDIIINPNSKIALKSLSIGVDTSELEIDSSNDNINFQLSDAKGIQTAQLTHGSYDATNSNILFNDMNISMNASLDTSSLGVNHDIGVEIKNSINTKTTKFECNFKIVKLDEYFDDMVFNRGTVDVTTTGSSPSHTFRGPSGGDPEFGECFFFNKINICKGGGVFRLKRTTISATAGTHAIIGFTDTNPDELPDKTSFNGNIIFGIEVSGIGDVYGYVENNNTYDAGIGVACELNDFIEIGISNGELVSRVWKTGGVTEVSNKPYTFNNLYPVVIIQKRDSDIRFGTLRYTPNPYVKNQSNIVPLIDEVGATPPRQGGSTNPTNHFLEFESEELSSYLGFKTDRIPQTGYTLTNNFVPTADRIFKPNNLSDSFILEMLNIGLDSYDGELQSRASYLAVIPKEDNNSFVVYETPYPIYIDINNYQPLTLRNIKCRLLNNDLSPVQMLGLGTIVLLLE